MSMWDEIVAWWVNDIDTSDHGFNYSSGTSLPFQELQKKKSSRYKNWKLASTWKETCDVCVAKQEWEDTCKSPISVWDSQTEDWHGYVGAAHVFEYMAALFRTDNFPWSDEWVTWIINHYPRDQTNAKAHGVPVENLGKVMWAGKVKHGWPGKVALLGGTNKRNKAWFESQGHYNNYSAKTGNSIGDGLFRWPRNTKNDNCDKYMKDAKSNWMRTSNVNLWYARHLTPYQLMFSQEGESSIIWNFYKHLKKKGSETNWTEAEQKLFLVMNGYYFVETMPFSTLDSYTEFESWADNQSAFFSEIDQAQKSIPKMKEVREWSEKYKYKIFEKFEGVLLDDIKLKMIEGKLGFKMTFDNFCDHVTWGDGSNSVRKPAYTPPNTKEGTPPKGMEQLIKELWNNGSTYQPPFTHFATPHIGNNYTLWGPNMGSQSPEAAVSSNWDTNWIAGHSDDKYMKHISKNHPAKGASGKGGLPRGIGRGGGTDPPGTTHQVWRCLNGADMTADSKSEIPLFKLPALWKDAVKAMDIPVWDTKPSRHSADAQSDAVSKPGLWDAKDIYAGPATVNKSKITAALPSMHLDNGENIIDLAGKADVGADTHVEKRRKEWAQKVAKQQGNLPPATEQKDGKEVVTSDFPNWMPKIMDDKLNFGHFDEVKNICFDAFQECVKDRVGKSKKYFGSADKTVEYTWTQMWAEYVQYAARIAAEWYMLAVHNNAIYWKWATLCERYKRQPNTDQSNLLAGIEKLKQDAEKAANDRLKKVHDTNQEDPNAPKPPEKDDWEDKLEERKKAAGQCVLLTNMSYLGERYHKHIKDQVSKNEGIHEIKGGLGLPWQGRFHLIDVKNKQYTKIPNYLSVPNGELMKPMLDATPDIISSLTPKIRLFKVWRSRGAKKKSAFREVETEFIFENHENQKRIQGLSSAKFDKGNGCGIKQFTFSFDGATPASAKKDIKAELTLFFQNFSDLTKVRGHGINRYRYIDMILHPSGQDPYDTRERDVKKSFPKQNDPNDAANYRIRADVGWHHRDDNGDKEFKKILKRRGFSSNQLSAALDAMNKSFYLNMIDHELDVRNDGTVQLTIKYAAYIESQARSNGMDALSTPAINGMRDKMQSRLDKMARHEKCTREQYDSLKQSYDQIENELVRASYQSIIKRLATRKCLWTATIDSQQLKQYLAGGSAPTNIRSNIDGQTLAGAERVQYFYLGDLIYTLLDCMYTDPGSTGEYASLQINSQQINIAKNDMEVGHLKQRIRNTTLLVTGFNYDDYTTAKPTDYLTTDMAQIPVSVKYFQEWLTQNVIKRELTSYPLLNFIRDILTMLTDLLLEVCINRTVDKTLMFQTGHILSVAPKAPSGGEAVDKFAQEKGSDIRIYADELHRKKILPLKTASKSATINEMWNYMFLYPVTSINTAQHKGKGDRKEDMSNGVYHFDIGSNRGLLKKVSFKKTDIKYLREARFVRQGASGLSQLGAVYNVTLDMVGNTIYYPGMEFWLDPQGIGGLSSEWNPRIGPKNNKKPSVANALGIGGYHVITKVKSTIAHDKFNTQVTAIWHYSGDDPDKGGENKAGSKKENKQSTKWKKWCDGQIVAAEKYQDDLAEERLKNEQKNIEAETKKQDEEAAKELDAAGGRYGEIIDKNFVADEEMTPTQFQNLPSHQKGAPPTVVSEGNQEGKGPWKIYKLTDGKQVLVYHK